MTLTRCLCGGGAGNAVRHRRARGPGVGRGLGRSGLRGLRFPGLQTGAPWTVPFILARFSMR